MTGTGPGTGSGTGTGPGAGSGTGTATRPPHAYAAPSRENAAPGDVPGAPAADWWYVRAYPGGPGAMDAAVRAALPWLAARAAELDAPAWHFLRFWDATGHHLRLRLRCTPDQADALHARTDELRALLTDLPQGAEGHAGEAGGGLLPAEPSMAPRRQPVGVSPAPYAPELAKYGGVHGIHLAEDVFTDGCALLAETDLVALPAAHARAAAAVALTQALVTACLAPGERDAFWTAHRRRWLARLRMALPADETRQRLNSLASAVRDAPWPQGAVRARLDAHVRVTRGVLDRCTVTRVPVPRAELLLHHVHMAHNRLGFPPPEEAALVLVARGLMAP
ncbi:lantibiotic dehydratase C-terminal domain-containing protein [Streptomyces diacarni]|uniref:lantibiotic dehydratase C-terminal domain-containing protein n=1 Tax=Streptomyces diacarni TaxID=2800381 RepID=UPI0033DACA61